METSVKRETVKVRKGIELLEVSFDYFLTDYFINKDTDSIELVLRFSDPDADVRVLVKRDHAMNDEFLQDLAITEAKEFLNKV